MAIGESKEQFLKTKYYPVDIEKKVIINLPFSKERNLYLIFKIPFIGIKGKRLNDHKCYLDFTILESNSDAGKVTHIYHERKE